ncbi:hypothetical protein [Chitinophaga sp. LS1]|uniref:hypothetical protein n=1 Tax=Chitinophaga sp. LS1 TaxID=3051176 RepID=UPI002AABB18D|nr:hypothetical protein [Chitinophaga sp. LS1]WPV65686.1 hypothetical protein QQL36_28180 [Chitinophaga sp. LS1]
MEGWSLERFKDPAIFIVPFAGIICALFGWITVMIHIFKVQPEKLWLYRKSSWIRYFVNSEIKHVATDENYILRARGGAIVFLFIGTVVTIVCIINLVNFIISCCQNPHH